MAHDLRQFSGNGTVDVLDDVEVCGEEDIKVALVNLVLSAAILLKKRLVDNRKRNSQKV